MLKKMKFLKAAENKETFFKRISLIFPPLDNRYKAIEMAYDTAKDAFRGIYRDDKETRYFEHIRAVALILVDYMRIKDHEIIIAALLHDIVEDIEYWSIDKIENIFGKRVALLVQYLTKPSHKEYKTPRERDNVYHGRFAHAPRDFFFIKLADRLHNILTLTSCPPEKQKRKLEETRLHYMPYAERELILLHELEDAIEIVEKSLRKKEKQKTAKKKATMMQKKS